MSEERTNTAAENAGYVEEEKKQYVARKRWLLFGLPFTFTKYTIGEDVLTIDTGFFTRNENDCYMYKVQDVQYSASLLERMAGLGTITCFTGDTTDPKLEIRHIKKSKEIKNFILEKSEKMRMKRRTLTTMSLNSDADAADGVDDIG